MRKQEIDSLREPLILNLKDRTLDLGNWCIKINLCTYSLIWTWFLGCGCMQPSSWNAVNVGFVSSNATSFESWKLCNAHDILSYFGDLNFFFFLPFFLCEKKHKIDCLFLKDVITHATSSYLLQISLGTPLECMFWFNHLTIFYDDSGAIWRLITEILIVGFIPFFLFKTFYYSTQQGNIRLWDWSCTPLKDGNGLWCNPTPQVHWIVDSNKIGPEMQEKALGFSWALG